MSRSVEPRLDGVEYASCRPDPKPDDLLPEPVCAGAEREAAKRAKPAAGRTRGPSGSESPEDLGSLLARRDERSADTAVARCERLVREAPGDAARLVNLAAAYIVRAQRRDEPFDLIRALETADRAVKVSPARQEARFNRALALELLFLDVEAEAAWKDYLRLDRTSPWRVEARSRMAAVHAARQAGSWLDPLSQLRQEPDETTVRGLVRRDSQGVREAVENDLLGDWADAEGRGDRAEAARLLRTLRLVGDILAETRGEHLVQDTVSAISVIGKHGNLLVEGHREFRDGRSLYKLDEVGRARERLEAARASLERAGSPFAARAAFWVAACDFRSDRYASAYRLLRPLKSRVPAVRYPSLRAHIAWVEALSLGLSGKLLEAASSYQEALPLFERTGETRSEGEVQALLTELLEQLGMRREAWTHAYRALRETRSPGSPPRAIRIAADTILEEGRPQAALYFQDELVRRADLMNAPLALADALSKRAQMRGRSGRRTEALEDLHRAKQQAARQADPALRRQNLAHISTIEGELDLEVEPRKSVELLTSSLDYYLRAGNSILALSARRARARAYRRLGDLAEAEADLQAGFRNWEGVEASLSEEESRLAFLDRTVELVDEMIAFQVEERQSPERAFAYADLAHTQVLPARSAPAAPGSGLASLPMREIRRRLPADTTLVQFSIVEDRLFIWILTDRGAEFLESPLDHGGVDKLVGLVRSRKEALSDLFDVLVRPWLERVPQGESLVFIPDKALHAVPFAALRDRRTGRFLVKDHRVLVAPSATLYVNSLDRNRDLESRAGEGRALVVGDPAFDRRLFLTLTSLDAADAEARAVAALYPESDLLLGKQAGVKEFLALAPEARWIHFAGHALANDRNPLLSMLLFAGSSGALYARQIYQLDLQDTDLVVLSACSTAAISRGSSEGVTNLARAFLAAGAPNVVASLWEVDDRLTSRLFTIFHQKLLAHADPAEALREAQLSLLHDSDASSSDPAFWGAFEVFGGSVQSSSTH
jgi:tetratricopeptide (TPR) repeat protein